MGIGGVTSMNNMPNMQMTTASSTDSKSKSIQNEITDAQQEMQKLSSKEDLSANEKADERKKLQKEITSLNTELKQRQEELLKSQKREIMMAELQTDGTKEEAASEKTGKIRDNDSDTGPSAKEAPAAVPTDDPAQQAGSQGTAIAQNKDGNVTLKEGTNQIGRPGTETAKKQEPGISSDKAGEKNQPIGKLQADEDKEGAFAGKEKKSIGNDTDTNTGFSPKETFGILSADNFAKQEGRQDTVIARIRGGIAILKGEISQDEKLGPNTEKKREELEKLEKKEQNAMTAQFPALGEANNPIQPMANAKVSGTADGMQANTGNNSSTNAFTISNAEAQELQQNFYVSLGH